MSSNCEALERAPEVRLEVVVCLAPFDLSCSHDFDDRAVHCIMVDRRVEHHIFHVRMGGSCGAAVVALLWQIGDRGTPAGGDMILNGSLTHPHIGL